jgi:hypothetical protein
MFLADGALTLRDVAAKLKSDGKTFDSDMINLVYETNPLLQDLPVVEANDGSSNVTKYRIALPTVKFTGYREGVKPSKGGVTSVRNTAAHMDAIIEMSQREWDEAPDKNMFLADEALDQIEAMNQTQSNEMVYGSLAKNVRGYNGFFAHQKAAGYTIGGKFNGAHAHNDKHPDFFLMDAGGTLTQKKDTGVDRDGFWNEVQTNITSPTATDIRSIGLVGVGTRTVRGFYPRGTSAGIKKGEWKEHETLLDENGGKFEGCRQFLSWDFGLDIRDWRYVGWIRNLELASLDKRGPEQHIRTMLRRLSTRVGDCNKGSASAKWQWVMAKPVWEGLQGVFERMTASNAVSFQQIQDVMQPTLFGYRVVLMDCMNKAEEILPVAS